MSSVFLPTCSMICGLSDSVLGYLGIRAFLILKDMKSPDPQSWHLGIISVFGYLSLRTSPQKLHSDRAKPEGSQTSGSKQRGLLVITMIIKMNAEEDDITCWCKHPSPVFTIG